MTILFSDFEVRFEDKTGVAIAYAINDCTSMAGYFLTPKMPTEIPDFSKDPDDLEDYFIDSSFCQKEFAPQIEIYTDGYETFRLYAPGKDLFLTVYNGGELKKEGFSL